MNTYGKPTYQLNSMFNHFNELRHETNHVYDLVTDIELPSSLMRKFYEESNTVSEFKLKCKNHLGW